MDARQHRLFHSAGHVLDVASLIGAAITAPLPSNVGRR
jgi:hypothetical protein